jgi:hypothetical protein
MIFISGCDYPACIPLTSTGANMTTGRPRIFQECIKIHIEGPIVDELSLSAFWFTDDEYIRYCT